VELHMSYAHLSQDERYQIQHLRRGGFSVRYIAKQIERSPSTVSRELFRNGQADEYAARSAQRQSVLRRQAATSDPRPAVATSLCARARSVF
jgi:IS30 family transposase